MSKRVTQEQILTALNVYMHNFQVFRPERSKGFAPPQGTVIYEVFKSKKLTQKQCIAANVMYSDAERAIGSSQGLTGSYSECVQVSGHKQELLAYESVSSSRLRALVGRMHHHERKIFFLILKDYKNSLSGKLDIAEFGAVTSGYVSGQLARAAATGRLQAFLDTLVEFYNL